MELSYISIANYRSITSAYKIDLKNLTVLLGKNNEGKTNIMKAINIGMEIIRNMGIYRGRKRISKYLYDWHEDFPISLQTSRKLKDKKTSIRMDFLMTDEESSELFRKIDSNINGALSIYIKISENNTLSVTVPKRGKNAKAISNKIFDISRFICDRFDVQYIPAIRAENNAYNAIFDLINTELSSIEDQTYKDYIEYIEKVQMESLKSLEEKVKKPLTTFLPQIKSIKLNMIRGMSSFNHIAERNINIEIDDGVLTSLSNKGDGVKSLATIAMLSQISTKKERLIIVDEPENHLHPEAIRYINSVLCNLAENNQVLISTHNPIFVNRNNISSNILVDSGQTYKADRIDAIRETLGVIISDNLIYSDYVVVVEGSTDRDFLEKLFSEDEILKKYMDNNILTIRAVGGTNNISSEVYSLQRYCCNYIIILDYDKAGKDTANAIKTKLSVPNDKIRYFMRNNKRETELEDLYKLDIYKDYLLSKNIDITNDKFKDKTKKWSNRISYIVAESGIDFTEEAESQYKKEIVSLIEKPVKNYLTGEGYKLSQAICDKIKDDIDKMAIN